ncbi:MAG: hypothetical protein RLZZ08_938 [Pseudomonadota bacterium]|jgi:hypothetical protein
MGYPGDGRDDESPMDLDGDAVADGAEQLTLADPDERLPWLEAADDDFDEGVDSGRILAFALIGLLAVAALVGALWWFTRDRPDPEMIADGSTVEAPAEPYKVKPADQGGEKVAGTGDKSFEVAEGRTVEGRIAGEGPAAAPAAVPTPGIDRDQNGASAGAGTATQAPAAVSGGVGVQVGAYSSKDKAEAGWTQLQSRLSPLQGRSHRVIQGTADSGAIFRLQAVSGSVADAEALCHALRTAGGDCQVKR